MDKPIQALLGLIKGKYKAAILIFLSAGPHRFGDVRRELGDISERVLTKQLRELEAAGLVSRRVYPEVPPRVEYKLTPYGATLCPLLKKMWQWGQEHLARADAPKFDSSPVK